MMLKRLGKLKEKEKERKKMKKADVIGNRTRTIERTYRIILGKEKQVFKRNKSATPKERSSDQFSSD